MSAEQSIHPRFDRESEKPPLRSSSGVSDARFARLICAHLEVAQRVALRRGVSRDQVADVVQEVFIVVSQRLDAIDQGRERAFVVATTVRLAANWRRANRRRQEEPLQDAALTTCVALSCEASQEMLAVRHEGLQALAIALGNMTEGQREIFVMTELEQLSAIEIALQLQIAEAAVVSRLRRAREAFRRFCEERQRPRDL